MLTTDDRILAAQTTGLELRNAASIVIDGAEPQFASRFSLATAAAVANALVADRVMSIWQHRTGEQQECQITLRSAAASLVGFALQRLRAPEADLSAWEPAPDGDGFIALGSLGVLAGHNPPNPATNAYRAADGRWVQLHGGYPHLAEGLYDLLGVPADKSAMAEAIARWRSFELEERIATAGLCGVVARTAAQWRAHPQGRTLAGLPVVEVIRIGDARPRELPRGDRPLAGLRVLDLTRVLAGPTCARALAEHGADVLNVRSPRAPYVLPFVLDTGIGKRTSWYEMPSDSSGPLGTMAATADVVCDGYRAGSLARHGLGPTAIAESNPGVVVAQLNCYGFGGPWDSRRGWEQLAQNAVGLATPEDPYGEPVIVPATACDYTTGNLLAAGVLEALLRRSAEGGSWLVRASLCRTGMWIDALPRVAATESSAGAAHASLGPVDDLLCETDTAWGRLSHLAPLAQLSRTPGRFDLPPAPLGTHELRWLP